MALSYRSRALTALAVALPVPLLAALGLSLPLPATVARLAAKLVPFADRGALSAARSATVANGAIVLRPGEGRVAVQSTVPHERTTVSVRGRAAETHRAAVPGVAVGPRSTPATEATPTAATAAQKTDAASASSPSASAAPVPGGTQPDPSPTPAPAPTPTPTQVIDTVTTTASTAVSSVVSTVTTATKPVGGIVGGIHP